jgi:tRNA threonylcarbamoyladenosine biosynthesis protein TsaE
MALALELAPLLPDDATLCFFGDLAAGKTTFIKGLAAYYEIPPEKVTSPTFVYLNIYKGKNSVYHFDLWRLKDSDEFLSLGFDEFLEAPGLKCLEWSERIQPLLPAHVIKVTLAHGDDDERLIKVEGL